MSNTLNEEEFKEGLAKNKVVMKKIYTNINPQKNSDNHASSKDKKLATKPTN